MKVAFHEVTGDQYVRRITDDGWFPGNEVTTNGPIDGRVALRRTGSDRVEVTGSLSFAVVASCDRCCRPVSSEVAVEFSYHCLVGEEVFDGAAVVAECREEDCHTVYVAEPIIDLGVLLREQVFLAIPARTLCRSDCRGLCQQCGIDLNDSTCSCRQSGGSGPFAVLRRMKGR